MLIKPDIASISLLESGVTSTFLVNYAHVITQIDLKLRPCLYLKRFNVTFTSFLNQAWRVMSSNHTRYKKRATGPQVFTRCRMNGYDSSPLSPQQPVNISCLIAERN